MLIKSIKLKNFLSFAGDGEEIQLGALNVIIGPNGSGKSNFLESFELLRNVPGDLARTIREGGGVGELRWKGVVQPADSLALMVVAEVKFSELRYGLVFDESEHQFVVRGEVLEDAKLVAGNDKLRSYYDFGRLGCPPMLAAGGVGQALKFEDVDFQKSILAQRRDPVLYPQLTALADAFSEIRLYRDWSFGRRTAPRMPQRADMPNDMLEPDAGNLGLVLNRLRREPDAKARLLEALRKLYDGIEDFDVRIEGGTVQVFFQEGRNIIPATRLSDGTLRYLCLLAILCHPKPPPLVCVEEPELGLHPDIMPTLADLLKEASARCQLVVTTHSDILVDALSDTPESVLVCERGDGGTTLRHLDPEKLKPWLEEYRLGDLWTRGDIGGVRW